MVGAIGLKQSKTAMLFQVRIRTLFCFLDSGSLCVYFNTSESRFGWLSAMGYSRRSRYLVKWMKKNAADFRCVFLLLFRRKKASIAVSKISLRYKPFLEVPNHVKKEGLPDLKQTTPLGKGGNLKASGSVWVSLN